MRDTERCTLIEEAIASTPINNLPNSNSPSGVDENEVVDCRSVDEARFVSKECKTEISFPPNVHVDFLACGYNEDYHDISIMSEESEVNDGHDATFDEKIYDDSTEVSCMSSSDEEYENKIHESKFIVFWSSLSILLKFCLSCHKLAWIGNIVTGGALLIVKMNCIDGHESECHSSYCGQL